jgi:hypothetical protein
MSPRRRRAGKRTEIGIYLALLLALIWNWL